MSRWKYLFAFLLISSLSLSGCFQYPEGPVFTLLTQDERLQGTWAIVSVHLEDGTDVTSEYKTHSLSVEFNRSGGRFWTLYKNAVLDSYGSYQFADNGDELIIFYSIIGGDDASYQAFYTVRKLTDKQFKYIDDNGITLEWEKY